MITSLPEQLNACLFLWIFYKSTNRTGRSTIFVFNHYFRCSASRLKLMIDHDEINLRSFGPTFGNNVKSLLSQFVGLRTVNICFSRIRSSLTFWVRFGLIFVDLTYAIRDMNDRSLKVRSKI